VASLCSTVALGKEYQFIWNPYCPYTCDADKEHGREGVAIDIIREIFKHRPDTVTFRRIDSWLRAKRLVASGVSDGMAFTFYNTEQEEPPFIIPSSAMVVSQGSAYLSLIKNQIDPYKTSDLAQFHVIGGYRGSVVNDQDMVRFIKHNPDKMAYFTGTNILERVSHMIAMGRLDIWLDSADLLRYFVSKTTENKFAVSEAISVSKEYGGMMFISKKPDADELAIIIGDGLKALRKSGKLNQLLANYGMTDSVESQP